MLSRKIWIEILNHSHRSNFRKNSCYQSIKSFGKIDVHRELYDMYSGLTRKSCGAKPYQSLLTNLFSALKEQNQ